MTRRILAAVLGGGLGVLLALPWSSEIGRDSLDLFSDVEMVRVLRANEDLPAGTVLAVGTFSSRSVPANFAGGTFVEVEKRSSIVGQTLVRSLTRGEVLLRSHLEPVCEGVGVRGGPIPSWRGLASLNPLLGIWRISEVSAGAGPEETLVFSFFRKTEAFQMRHTIALDDGQQKEDLLVADTSSRLNLPAVLLTGDGHAIEYRVAWSDWLDSTEIIIEPREERTNTETSRWTFEEGPNQTLRFQRERRAPGKKRYEIDRKGTATLVPPPAPGAIHSVEHPRGTQ